MSEKPHESDEYEAMLRRMAEEKTSVLVPRELLEAVLRYLGERDRYLAGTAPAEGLLLRTLIRRLEECST